MNETENIAPVAMTEIAMIETAMTEIDTTETDMTEGTIEIDVTGTGIATGMHLVGIIADVHLSGAPVAATLEALPAVDTALRLARTMIKKLMSLPVPPMPTAMLRIGDSSVTYPTSACSQLEVRVPITVIFLNRWVPLISEIQS